MRTDFEDKTADKLADYFGEETATYFVFLDYYNRFCGWFGVYGLIVLIFGIVQKSSFVEEICDADSAPGKWLMCPICDRSCDFWHLSNICSNTKLTYIFDNYLSILYGLRKKLKVIISTKSKFLVAF